MAIARMMGLALMLASIGIHAESGSTHDSQMHGGGQQGSLHLDHELFIGHVHDDRSKNVATARHPIIARQNVFVQTSGVTIRRGVMHIDKVFVPISGKAT